MTQIGPKFSLGQTVATPGALEALGDARVHPFRLLLRHSRGDWGDVGAEDRKANDRALSDGDRLLSAYHVGPNRTKVWIITEADRSVTTILLPSEY